MVAAYLRVFQEIYTPQSSCSAEERPLSTVHPAHTQISHTLPDCSRN